MTGEGRVKSKVRNALRNRGFVVVPLNMTGIGMTGLPDDLIIVDGRALFVEFKYQMRWTSLKTLPRPNQAAAMELLRSAGAVCYVIDMGSAEEFIKLMVEKNFTALQKFEWRWTLADYIKFRNRGGTK